MQSMIPTNIHIILASYQRGKKDKENTYAVHAPN